MIDTSSVESLINTLPVNFENAKDVLNLKIYDAKESTKASISVARKGYLGCLAIGVNPGSENKVVLRLLPDVKISKSTIAVAWEEFTEGMTIASDLEHFVAGRIAQRCLAEPEKLPSLQSQAELIEFAKEFGDFSNCKTVIDSLEYASTLEGSFRISYLWEAAGQNIPLFRTLSTARKVLNRRQSEEWILKAIQEIPEIDIVWRLYASLYIFNKTIDLEKATKRLINSNDIFDPTYEVMIPGQSLKDWEKEILVQAVKWLEEKKLSEPPVPADLWHAVQTFASNPKKYDGSLHLDFARRIAKDDPKLAYTQTCNAAGYFVRVKHKLRLKQLILLINLPKKINGRIWKQY